MQYINRLISLISDAWVFYYAKNLLLTDDDPTEQLTTNQIEVVQSIGSESIVDIDRKFSM